MKNNLIKKIDEALISQITNGDNEAINALLKDQGYDLQSIEEYTEKKFKKQAFILKGLMNKQKDIILLERASFLLHNAIEKNIDKPISFLKSLIANNQFQVQYRNLDHLGVDEIKEIIKDQNLLELLEQLQNEEK